MVARTKGNIWKLFNVCLVKVNICQKISSFARFKKKTKKKTKKPQNKFKQKHLKKLKNTLELDDSNTNFLK